MKQYGLVKTINIDGENIKLCGNAMTFILYKSYFGRDLLNDIIKFAKKNTNTETLEKLKKYNIEKVDDLENLSLEETTDVLGTMESYEFDSEFILNFVASLIATAEYPNKLEVGELIMSVPPTIVTNNEIIMDLLEFFSVFISQKKR